MRAPPVNITQGDPGVVLQAPVSTIVVHPNVFILCRLDLVQTLVAESHVIVRFTVFGIFLQQVPEFTQGFSVLALIVEVDGVVGIGQISRAGWVPQSRQGDQ